MNSTVKPKSVNYGTLLYTLPNVYGADLAHRIVFITIKNKEIKVQNKL